MLASQSVSDTDNKGSCTNIKYTLLLNMYVHLIGAVAALQKLNQFSKKFSMKQITSLKELGSCLPEKSFKKSASKLTDRCKQVKMLEFTLYVILYCV